MVAQGGSSRRRLTMKHHAGGMEKTCSSGVVHTRLHVSFCSDSCTTMRANICQHESTQDCSCVSVHDHHGLDVDFVHAVCSRACCTTSGFRLCCCEAVSLARPIFLILDLATMGVWCNVSEHSAEKLRSKYVATCSRSDMSHCDFMCDMTDQSASLHVP